jgi:hypothetical protein
MTASPPLSRTFARTRLEPLLHYSNAHSNASYKLPATYLVLGTIVFLTKVLYPRYPEPQTWMRRGHSERLYGTIRSKRNLQADLATLPDSKIH